MKYLLRLRNLLLVAFAFLLSAASAEATHFRFGHLTWRRMGPGTAPGSHIVEITVTEAWRSTGLGFGEIAYDFGDSTGIFTTSGAVLGPLLSDVAGEQYRVGTVVITHQYGGPGPFTVSGGSCCRISSLVNAGDNSERLEMTVDLRNGNLGSPVASIPIILQLPKAANLIPLAIGDPDLDPLTCRLATGAESEIFSVPSAGGKSASVTSACELSWDTTATTIGEKYAIQVMIEENHPGNAPTARNALDFIIEIVGGVNRPPTCAGTSGNHVIPSGTTFSANFLGTDPEGSALRVAYLGLPPGAVVNPASGSSGASPLPASIDWTPGVADRGSAHSVTVLYTDAANLQASCTFSVSVPNNTAPDIQCPSDIVLPAPGSTQVDFTVGDADGDGLTYAIYLDANPIPVVTGGVPAGPPPNQHAVSELVGPLTGGAHIVTLEVNDGIFASRCTFQITVLGQPPTVAATVVLIASGKLCTLSAVDDLDPNPKIYVKDSASAFVAGPFANGDQVVIRVNPSRAPSSRPGSGSIKAQISLKGPALLYGTDADGNTSATIPVP